MKLTIYRKLLLSYLAMALLTVLAGAYAVYSLRQLNELAYRIISEDFTVVDLSKKLLDAVIAQEGAAKRYLILRDPTIEEIFWSRSREFKRGLGELKNGRFPALAATAERLAVLHSAYDGLFARQIDLVLQGRMDEAQSLSEILGKEAIDEMASFVRGIQRGADKSITERMNEIGARGDRASRLTAALSLVSILAGMLIVLLVTYNISRPLGRLEKATAEIAEGKFDHDLRLGRRDEIGSLARAFEAMARRLKVLEEINLDASPLTGLPGNLAIEREIEKRLAAKAPFSLCHVDLDNFKPFVDMYGYAWGSEVIKEVARLLIVEMKTAGAPEDFLGHIGGDDFVIIAAPQRAERICRETAAGFDGRIRTFYSEEDRERGFFIGNDREGRRRQFPLITVTIAIVTDDGTRFANPLEMAEAAARLKEYAKTLPGSNYVTEKDVRKA